MNTICVDAPHELPVRGEYDIIVVGGGIAGCAAALAAVRMGKKTLLIEKQTVLGGLATSGHIVLYLPLCDGYGHKVIGGIAEELLWDSIRYSYGDDLENWQDKRRYETRFNGPTFALTLERKLLAEKVDILQRRSCLELRVQVNAHALRMSESLHTLHIIWSDASTKDERQ